MAENETNEMQSGDATKIIQPQKVYLKDISFETPNTPRIFTKKWEPEIQVEFQGSASKLEDDLYEVVASVTVTATIAGETAYLAEVQQAGIFTMQGFSEPELHKRQNVYCLRILYPYASAAISDLVTRGGFPTLLLSPLNFDKMYQDRINKLMESAQDKGDRH